MDGGFFKLPYSPPPALPVEQRGNFGQVLQYFPEAKAVIQARRCVSCDAPGCNTGCGVGQDIPGFLQKVSLANASVPNSEESDKYWLQAHKIAVRSPLYGLFGQICPQQEGLCESQCTVGYLSQLGQKDAGQHKLKDTIPIGGVESIIWRKAIDSGWLNYAKPLAETNRSVAIVGAGPAGIFAALGQRRAGHRVTVIDEGDEIGGLMLKHIPHFKLEKRDFPFVRAAMEATGIKFQMNSPVGDGPGDWKTLQDLLASNDAVILGTGTYAARKIMSPQTGSPIEGHKHVIDGLDYLLAHNNNVRSHAAIPAGLQTAGKRVIVIGPGDTGQDCVRTALRTEPAQVIVVCRNPPRGALKERMHADEEQTWLRQQGMGGIDYELHASPTKVAQLPEGSLEVQIRRNGKPHTIVADIVINATGFEEGNPGKTFGIAGLEIIERKTTMNTVFRDGTTTIPNLFVTGDALYRLNSANYPSRLAVHAGQSGRYVSGTVRRFLASLAKPAA